jgi:hypothetical protein
MGRVLIVALDGLDKELIEKYQLGSLQSQEVFGGLNNFSGITTQVTPELWASFITGSTYRDHGVIGLKRQVSDTIYRIEKLKRFSWWRKFQGLRQKLYSRIPFLASEKRKYDRRDLNTETIFEDIPNSKAIDVRSYNIGYNYGLMKPLEFDVDLAVEELERFTEWKKQELFDSMEADYDMVMAHFHKADHIHHWFWEVGKMDKVEETYREMDEMAAEIQQKAEEEGFDTVLFMSDHGLPDVENGGHNENAFYSCNRELFGDKTPHITDFHDKILELCDRKVTSGVDI